MNQNFARVALAGALLALPACGDRVEVPGNTRPPVVRPTPNPDGCTDDRENGPRGAGGGVNIPRPSDC